MNRRFIGRLAGLLCTGAWLFSAAAPQLAQAAGEAPDQLVQRLSSETLDRIKTDPTIKAGDTVSVMRLVDQKIMPHVNFTRMTSSAVGPTWRQASAAQKKALEDEFKKLLVRTYAGALAQVSDQKVDIKPMRARADDTDVLVRSEIVGRGDPIQLDYRLVKGSDGDWKIYNINVLGIWMVDTYRSQFAQEINSGGLDGLIATLSARNKQLAGR
ncbi:MAG: ABC transporter substrate-binding protein [Burkholderiales bacterium]